MMILAGVVAMALFNPQGADAQNRAACSTGSGVRIEALAGGVEITYRVTNRRRDPITWLQLGTSAAIVLTHEEMPRISNTPAGWSGMVVRDEDSTVRVVWEAGDASHALAFGSQIDVGLRVRTVYVQRPGQKDAGGKLIPYFNYRSLPFTARTASGACWSGRTSDPYASPEGGNHASMRGAAVRTITSHPRTPILVDVPVGESLLRLSRRHAVFLTVPLALTFGVDGGFSADMSIGIGLTWKPTPHISASAKRTFGTFFFNNRTHLRTFGIDATIPIARTFIYEGVTREKRHLVVGVEVFQRDVVKWAGFMHGPQWYASGTGFAIRAGIRTMGWSWT